MADPNGIRATGLRPVAILKKDNYRSWAVKLKVQLKVVDCWLLVSGTDLEPPLTAPAVAAAVALRKSWDKRRDGASAALITSISYEELHVLHGIDEDPPAIWIRLREKFERRSVGFQVTAGCRNICNLNKYSISRYSVERASVSERRV